MSADGSLPAGSSDGRFVPARLHGWAALSAERQPFRSRRTPSASGRRPSAAGRASHIILRSEPAPTDAASGWRLSLPAYSASVASSCVRSIILMGERFLHFQLNRNSEAKSFKRGPCQTQPSASQSVPAMELHHQPDKNQNVKLFLRGP